MRACAHAHAHTHTQTREFLKANWIKFLELEQLDLTALDQNHINLKLENSQRPAALTPGQKLLLALDPELPYSLGRESQPQGLNSLVWKDQLICVLENLLIKYINS